VSAFAPPEPLLTARGVVLEPMFPPVEVRLMVGLLKVPELEILPAEVTVIEPAVLPVVTLPKEVAPPEVIEMLDWLVVKAPVVIPDAVVVTGLKEPPVTAPLRIVTAEEEGVAVLRAMVPVAEVEPPLAVLIALTFMPVPEVAPAMIVTLPFVPVPIPPVLIELGTVIVPGV
jgi:hypothetical protein